MLVFTTVGQTRGMTDSWVLDSPDAEKFLHPGQIYFNYDKLFQEARVLDDGKRKFELMQKMEDLVNADLPWVMQYYARNYILSHKYLKNFLYSDLIYNNVKYWKIKGK